jgi:hypothetical protein
MVESTPFDEDWDEQDPYDTALNSDEDTEQLRMVSQEDDLADCNEDAPHKSIVSFSNGSKKSPATSGADPTVVGSANQSPGTSGASKPPARSIKVFRNLGSNPVGHLWLKCLERGAGPVGILWLKCPL